MFTPAIIFGGLLVLWIGLLLLKLRGSAWVTNAKGYFLAGRSMDQNDFIDSTVAYGYQVAAVSLFATWGYTYGFWTIWVPVFWGLGFWLLKVFLDKGLLKVFLDDDKLLTIHGFLSKHFKTSQLAKVAGLATLMGLSGTAFFEAEFTGNLIATATFPAENATWIGRALFFLFVIVALLYVLRGGLGAVYSTDRLRLRIGFVAFNLFSIYAYSRAILQGNLYTGWTLFFLSGLAVLALYLLYLKQRGWLFNSGRYSNDHTLLATLLLYVLAGVGLIIYARNMGVVAVDSMRQFAAEQQVSNVFSLGGLSLVSLLLANGLWQFVDISSWQRLAALSNSPAIKERLSKAMMFSAIYSPVTWLIAIFFGMSLRYVGFDLPDAWTALQSLLWQTMNGSLLGAIAGFIFLFGLMAIMFSTLDSLLSALSFTTYHDIIGSNDAESSQSLYRSRVWTVVYTTIFMVIYFVVRLKVEGIDGILYTFYAFQLALLPPILMILLRRRLNAVAAYLSIFGGSVCSLIPLLVNNDDINPYSAAAVFSVGGSVVFYAIGHVMFRGCNTEQTRA